MSEVKTPKELTGFTEQVTGSSQPRDDVITGWDFKTNDINSAEIDGLVPFVQLYGLYSEQEIQKLLNNDPDWLANAVTAVFVGEEGEEYNSLNTAAGHSGWQPGQAHFNEDMLVAGMPVPTRRTISDDQRDFIDTKLRSKFIQINIKDSTRRGDDQWTPGILLATNKAQAGNEAYEYYSGSNSPREAGGVGITELQIETGTKEFMNRRYKLRLTVTDPQELNEEAEYLKLTSLQSQFLIIHGWSSPNSLNGWPGDPPPILEPPSDQFPNGRMSVDLTQENTGGAWGAAVVATTIFDFAFNEIGQLEANFTFMPREISFLATYRVPTVADTVKKFLGTGEKVTPTDPLNPDSAPNVFAGLSTGLGASLGLVGKNLADVIFDEQNGYVEKSDTVRGLFDNIEDGTGINVSSEISNWAETDSEWTGNSASLMDRQKEREGRFRFPYAGPGIRVYTKERRQVLNPERTIADAEDIDENTDDNPMSLRPGYKWVTENKSKIAYYYLGWVLEAVRFSMYDLNQQKARRGETPFNVRFKYMAVPEKSQSTFNLSFQDILRSGMVPSTKNYIQEATKFLMTNCFPAFTSYNPMWQELQIYHADRDAYGGVPDLYMRPMTPQDMEELPTAAAYNILGIYNDIKVDATQWIQNNIDETLSWSTASENNKIKFLSMKSGLSDGLSEPTGWKPNWRQTLVTDENNYIRILHPRYDGQLLYTYVAYTTVLGEGNIDKVDVEETKGPVLGSRSCPAMGSWGRNYRSKPNGLRIQAAVGTMQIIMARERSLDNWAAKDIDYISRVLDWPISDKADKEVKFIDELGGRRPPGLRHLASGKFIGDITYSSDYGLVMPAEVARYYSPEYLALQRKWYNTHIAFLAKTVQNIVSQRISEAVDQGKDLYDLGPEPVDLYWLTGKKYFTPAVTYGIEVINPRYQPAWPIAYTFDEIKNKGDQLRISSNLAVITDLQNRINEANVEKQRIESINSGENISDRFDNREDIYGRRDDPLAGEAQIDLALNRLRIPGMSPQSVILLENNVAYVIGNNRGLVAEIAFWNERINGVLAELYNKDIIDIEGAGGGNGNPTLSSREARLSVDTDQIETLRRQLLRRTIDLSPSRRFSNLMPHNPNTGHSGYYLVFSEIPGNDNSDDNPHHPYASFRDLLQSGYAFDSYLEQLNFGIGVRRFVVSNYVTEFITLTLATVDLLGDIGFTKEDIDNDNWPSGAWMEYLFMNWMSASWRDKYFSGVSMYVRMWDSDDSPERRAFSTARQDYFDYITQQRTTIKRYLENINKVNEKIAKLQLSTDNIDRIIADWQYQLDGALTIERLIYDQTVELSPFQGAMSSDSSQRLPKGGGRYVQLDTIVAQQWEQRFQKREVFGSNDIHNYGPPIGGLPYHDPVLPYWGWLSPWMITNNQNHSYMISEKIKIIEIKGKPNFGDWDGPKEILNLEKLRSGGQYGFGRRPEGDAVQSYNVMAEEDLKPEDQWINDQPNILCSIGSINRMDPETGAILANPNAGNDSPVGAGAAAQFEHRGSAILLNVNSGNIVFAGLQEFTINLSTIASINDEEKALFEAYGELEEKLYITPIQVKHLCRAEMINFDLIATILKDKYGFDDVGYELGENVKTIAGLWPTSFHISYDSFLNKASDELPTEARLSGVAADDDLIVEPYYRVDKDLDFVEEAYRQSTEGMKPFDGRGKPGERHLSGLDPMELIKIPHSSCVFGPLTIANRRNIMYPASTGRRLAMNDHLPAITRVGAQQLVIRNDAEREARTATGANNAARYAPQLDWLKPVEKSAATAGFYTNEGRPAYSDEYPYGVPAGTPVPPPNSFGGYEGGYQPVPQPSSRHWKELAISQNNAVMPFEGFVDDGHHDGNRLWPSNAIYFGTGVPDMEKMGSWQAGRGAGYSAGVPNVGGAASPRIHDILYSLPDPFQYGFFSSVKDADENFGGGSPLNAGLVKFINEHLIQLLHMGRRIGFAADRDMGEDGPAGETLKNYSTGGKYNIIGQKLNDDDINQKIRDVTYGDCFNEFISRSQNTADFSNQSITNVAEIPIKREVVDNLLNRRNHNMSLLQFCQQILSPSSIGLAGNVQIGVRNNNGIVEIFPASISYKGIVQDMFKNAAETEDRDDVDYNQLVFDYKRKNSLIQSIDMSSKMDPAAFLTYQNSSDVLRGRDYNVLKLLSIDGVASEMSEFLSAIPRADDDSGGTYDGIVNVAPDQTVRINKVAFENIPSGILDSFVAQDPQRWAQITAMMQEQNNFTTELLAFYMRSVSLIIHGTTNIEPFNLINVKGVLPALEGIYIVTNLTQRITPTDFQTIIEGKLLKRRRMTRTGSEFI